MNQNPNAILFAGEQRTVLLRDGRSVTVRVRELPARHHLELLELFHVGREADLIQRCCEQLVDPAAPLFVWAPVDAAFVDNLNDEGHEILCQLADRLNFQRAIRTAQRQVARGQEMRPLMESMQKTMLAPLRQELASWTSSLTQQLYSALAETKPSEKR